MILHADLILCATDLVTGKESPLIEMIESTTGSETTVDPLYGDVRDAAGAYLIAAFAEASKDGG